MPQGDLPHTYPFRFVSTVLRPAGPDFADGMVSASVTGGDRVAMGEKWGSPVYLAEAMAQAALLLEGGDAESARRGFLAGIDGFEVGRVPVAGEQLEVGVRMSARFGAVVKFDAEIRSGPETVARGSILVRRGTPD
jgi:3-hydroxymyristoyl/3-hydroxydecanoyl-(acyl carrier protein) dehydratase